tara:strand:+ start:741 stop:1289 length:549 start_codon:yes stop_codon:yes gene_type:complete
MGTWFERYELDETIQNKLKFEVLWDMKPKEQHEIIIFGKRQKVPRLQKALGRNYKFSGTISESEDIPDFLQNVLQYFSNKYNYNFNMVLINWYRDGNDYIGFHSDDEPEIVENSPVITISLGATRDFILENKKTKEKNTYILKNFEVLVMGGTCQKTHKHCLPKRKKVLDPRISITIRAFKT